MCGLLKIKTDANLIGTGDTGQESVVITFATAEPVAFGIETHAGYDGYLYAVVIGKSCFCGF